MNHRLAYFIMFLISPLLSFYILIRRISLSNIVFTSTFMMGALGLLYFYDGVGDGTVHMEVAETFYRNMSLGNFLNEFSRILTQKPTISAVDPYIHILYFISAGILKQPQLLHLIAGLILGYVVGKALRLVFTIKNWQNSNNGSLIFLLVLLIVHTFSDLNAIRIGTAMWLSVYAVMSFLKYRKTKYLVYLACAIFIHLAYGLIIIPVVASLLFGKYKPLVVGVFFASFFFQIVEFDTTAYLPQTDVIESKTTQYVLDEDERASRQKISEDLSAELNFYKALGYKFYSFGISVLAFVFIPIFLTEKGGYIVKLLPVVYSTMAFSNVVAFIPSLSGRVLNLSTVILLFSAFIYPFHLFSSKNKWYGRSLKFTPYYVLAASGFFMLEKLSHLLNTTSVFFLALPVLSEITTEEISLKQFIANFI